MCFKSMQIRVCFVTTCGNWMGFPDIAYFTQSKNSDNMTEKLQQSPDSL